MGFVAPAVVKTSSLHLGGGGEIGPGNNHVSICRVLTWIRNQQDSLVPNPNQLDAHGLLGLATSLKYFDISYKCHFGEFCN